ncbi:glycoside hydrolase family 6 protein [Streptomyces sp. NPDC059037]|uniref:glycoside hydrolase family 6 protein n=1 Tax=Streptomyces sp. NPDC059037 TaxID=3346710 RepID=UPI0036804CE4
MAAALLLGAAASGCTEAPGASVTSGASGVSGVSGASGSVPQDTAFWVEPDSSAARQAAEWRRQGHTSQALLMDRIGGRAQAVWLHDEQPGQQVRTVTGAAAEAGRVPVLVAYYIPHRDCGDYSHGGAASAAEYRLWIEEFAAAIGDRAAYVIVEPDAVAQEVAGCAMADAEERYALLAHAVDRLKARPNTKVYLDAGNAGWIPDEQRLVTPLRQAGIAGADGFALNVSNYQTDAVSSAYGHRLAAGIGGAKHFVVDSSRNGNGPYTGSDLAWCNPPGRALGTPPTTGTGDAALDAYLWIKRPGESDGTCRGGPQVGEWWPQYALGLASRAKS